MLIARILAVCFAIGIFLGTIGLATVVITKVQPSWLGGILAVMFIVLGIMMAFFTADFGVVNLATRWTLWQNYRGVWLRATVREALRVMDLRMDGDMIVADTPTGPRSFGMIKRGDTLWYLNAPKQAYLVNYIASVSMVGRRDEDHALHFESIGELFSNEGMKILFVRAHAYHLMRDAQKTMAPQPGFGGMVLQQGKAAEVLYGWLSAERYAELSWRGMSCENMVVYANTPDFLLAALYPDNEPDWFKDYERHLSGADWHYKWLQEHGHYNKYQTRALMAEYAAAIRANKAKAAAK